MSDEHVKGPGDSADDQLWAELRTIESEAGPGDYGPLLDQLAAGTLTPGDEKKLRALAARDPKFALLVEAHEPLGNDWRERVADEIVASVTSTAPAGDDANTVDVSQVRALKPASPWGSGAKPFWSRPQIWGPALAAAALFLVIAIGIGEGSSMPRYGLEFSGGASEMRSPTAVQAGGGASVPRLSMGSPFEIVLRPETKLDGPVESRVYVAGSGATHGELRSVALRPERSELGTLRYRGEVGRDLGLRAGEHRVVVVVAPEGELPSDEWVADALSGARAPEGFQFLTQRVAVGGEP